MCARATVRALHGVRETRVAHDLSVAFSLLDAEPRWCAFIVDVRLGKECGLDFLAVARVRHPFTPALVLTGYLDAEAINSCPGLRATCMIKSVAAPVLRRFAESAVALAGVRGQLRRDVVATAVARFSLSAREERILSLAVAGVGRAAIPDAMDVCESTLRPHLRSLLRKCHRTELRDVVDALIAEAIDERLA